MVSFSDEQLISSKEKSNRKWNILRYILLLSSSIVYAYFFGGFFPYSVMYLMLSLPIISALHLFITCILFRMSENLSERIFIKGDCASYKLYLQNGTPFYIPYITIKMYMEGQIICKNLKSMRLALEPLSFREFQYDMPLLFRGRYDIGVKSVHIQDILGLFSFTLRPYERKSILVKPRIVETGYKDIPTVKNSEGELCSFYQEKGNDEIMNIREYSYGDSFRKIHWKLSSKLGKTMVKDTRNELDNDIIIALNLKNQALMNEERLLKEDCLIEELISLSSYLVKQNIPVKLSAYKDGPMNIRASSQTGFQSIYQFLSEVKFNETHDFNQALEYFSDNEQNSNLMCIFTVSLDADIVSKAFHIKNKGFDLEIYYINLEGTGENDQLSNQELIEMMIKNNIKAYKLEPAIMQIESSHHETTNMREKSGMAYEA